MFLPSYYNDEIIINTKTDFTHVFFELYCMGNNFAKYFAK